MVTLARAIRSMHKKLAHYQLYFQFFFIVRSDLLRLQIG